MSQEVSGFLGKGGRNTQVGNILFQKYKLLEEAGKGNKSQVFVAEHIKLHTLRAVKCIEKEKIPYEKLIKEAVYLKSLNHPGIPTIYDMEENETYFYIIEEYVQGESLKSMLDRQKKFSLKEIVEYGIQLCDIVYYLHTRKPYPIIHSDITPGNIIIKNQEIKLVDFGNAITLTGKEQRRDVYGTPGFMIPEGKENMVCNVKSDIYSVCAVLNSMCQQEKMKEEQEGYSLRKRKLVKILGNGIFENEKVGYETIAELRDRLMELEKEKKNILTSKRKEIRKPVSKTIGCIGITPNAGVTTTVFHVADEWRKRGRTALIELGERRDFGRWKIWQQQQGRYIENIKYGFRCDETDFYPMADGGIFLYVLNVGYDIIIVDFGVAENEDIIKEFQKCNKKVVLGNYCVWNFEQSLRRLELIVDEMNTEDWIYLTLSNDKKICHILENKLGIRITNFVPQNESLYENIIKEIAGVGMKKKFLKRFLSCFKIDNNISH